MGFFKQTKQQKERKAYKQILAKQTTQAARQAYSEESIKVAAERAKAKARRPSFGETLKGYAKVKMAKQPRKIKSTRKSKRRSKPPKQPQSLNEAMYGY